MKKLSIVWLRRNLRLEDNKVFAASLQDSEKVLPVFIFDVNILKRFSNPSDRRLSFLADTLNQMNQELCKFNGELLILYGDPVKIIPILTSKLNAEAVYADEDYEPSNIVRDQEIKKNLQNSCQLKLFYDHLLIKPSLLLTNDNKPYKVYTPYMKFFKSYLSDNQKLLMEYKYDLNHKLFSLPDMDLSGHDLKIINLNQGSEEILKQVGYKYKKDNIWRPENAKNVLNDFIKDRIDNYKASRDLLYTHGTSTISPYLRFGLTSIRECFRRALAIESNAGTETWVNELIWREFYASILYHFPNTTTEEFQVKYRSKMPWDQNVEIFNKFTEAKTGYPMVDAAVKQLLQDGWMHNRARMIVASFLTKNLLIDWRMGENFFAQYLMDYELASNVGGWQWAASCGTDAQPYFRIFNPFTQGKNFDPEAKYIKHYLPELEGVAAEVIHNVDFCKIYSNYKKPIVDYRLSRTKALEVFEAI